MKYLLALVLAFFSVPTWAVSMTQNNCSWDHPGVNPYKGNVEDAVEYYYDIPKAHRDVLKARIASKQADEVVDITKYGISGKHGYGAIIEEMHFGPNLICTTVTRTRWPEDMVQRAAVYCEDKYCIIVPYICGNLSRIKQLAKPRYEIPEVPFGSAPNFPPVPVEVAHVPEPGSILLMVGGLASLAFIRRKRK